MAEKQKLLHVSCIRIFQTQSGFLNVRMADHFGGSNEALAELTNGLSISDTDVDLQISMRRTRGKSPWLKYIF